MQILASSPLSYETSSWIPRAPHYYARSSNEVRAGTQLAAASPFTFRYFLSKLFSKPQHNHNALVPVSQIFIFRPTVASPKPAHPPPPSKTFIKINSDKHSSKLNHLNPSSAINYSKLKWKYLHLSNLINFFSFQSSHPLSATL